MEVKQIYSLMNDVTKEILGETTVVSEDLSNIVDVGKEILSMNDVDKYVKTLVNHIGKVIFVNRVYKGTAPSVLMDAWEFGSILEKITTELPEASENDSWNLTDGKSYDPNVFYQPKVSAKFYNNKVTFEINMSFTERQVKQSFDNATQLNAFLSMLFNSVDKSLDVKLDSLVMRTINNGILTTIGATDTQGENLTIASYESTVSRVSSPRAVNLLKDYNTKYGTTLTADECITNPEFIRYASFVMALYEDRLTRISRMFNLGAKDRFTSKDLLHCILLSQFASASAVYLQSDTFHDKYVALPNAETVPYWQGTGKTYAFNSTSEIIGKINDLNGGTVSCHANGILGVMFDRDALGVSNLDKRVTSNYNPKGEFYTNFYKADAGYFNDFNENFVVFYVA